MTREEIQKAANEFAEKHGFRVPYDGSNEFYDKVDVRASKDGFKAGAKFADKYWQEKTRWIPVEERLPKYGVAVLVKRPNKYSGNVDILLSRLHQAKKEGQEYGRGDGIGSYPKTFKDYWSLPSIALLGDITHWKEIE